MKNKKIAIISLLVLLIGLSIWEQFFITKSMVKIETMAENIKSDINNSVDTQIISDKIDKLSEIWDKTEYYFCFLISHNDMKEVGDSLNVAKTAVKTGENNVLLEKINLVIYYSKEYKEIMTFNIQNIL